MRTVSAQPLSRGLRRCGWDCVGAFFRPYPRQFAVAPLPVIRHYSLKGCDGSDVEVGVAELAGVELRKFCQSLKKCGVTGFINSAGAGSSLVHSSWFDTGTGKELAQLQRKTLIVSKQSVTALSGFIDTPLLVRYYFRECSGLLLRIFQQCSLVVRDLRLGLGSLLRLISLEYQTFVVLSPLVAPETNTEHDYQLGKYCVWI